MTRTTKGSTGTTGTRAPREGTATRRTAAVWGVGLALAASVGAAAVLPAPASAATRPYCGITWGSGPKAAEAVGTSTTTTAVRSGRHACFDRLVVDGAGAARVRYVAQVRADGSGVVVPLRGGARLEIVTTTGVDPATGDPTYLPARGRRADVVDVTGYRTFRQVAWAGDFEGQLTLGVGVRGRLPYRVFVLESPGRAPRVVVDVAHRW
jgi:hypothetical protein